MMAFIMWIWVYGSFLIHVGGEECVYQQGCSCYLNSTYCSGLGLRSIPPLVGTGIVDDLYIEYNSITVMPANSLPPNIKYLSLANNPVTVIADSVFDDCSDTLYALSFSGANFTSIPTALGHLRILGYLSILDTHIQDWNPGVMHQLGATVKNLYLEDCNIKAWPDWFKYFSKLREFSLADNSISTLPDDGFDNLINTVTSINLQNNSLNSIPRAMSKLLVIQELNLQMNRITDLTWLPSSTTLTMLYLNNNKLQDSNQLSQSLLPHANTLQQLNIEYNSLTSVPDLSFLISFGYLDFLNNHIYDSTSGDLPFNLTGVDFDSNNLRSIPHFITSLKSLTSFIINHNLLTQIIDYEFPAWTRSADMSFNYITELTDNSFPVNCSLESLELNNNPLFRISRQAFQNAPRLQYLDLQSTKLSRVPLGLLSGKGLLDVDFMGCDDLVCTCEEKDLAPWIASLNMYSISGTCGRTSIYDFFTQYVSGCPT